MRILIVEDDPGISGGLLSSLKTAGYAADVCENLSKAWSALLVEHFDAVLLDLACPMATASACWSACAVFAIAVPTPCRARICRC